jgi:hypothetical protein
MRPAEPVAWVLNLDAEDELSRPGAHTPTAAATARIATLLPKLAGLVREDDVILWPPALLPGPASPSRASARGLEGRAWCPTRWALEQLAAAGARLPAAPPMEVLRRVNHRRFALELGSHLPSSALVHDEAALFALVERRDLLEAATATGWWLLKRPFGYAGRGRKKLRPGGLTADERAWVRASFAAGEGLLVEPLVDRTLDLGRHGWLEPDGPCTWGQLTAQVIDDTGAWQGSRRADDTALTPEERALLTRTSDETAAALHRAGYFGPFGLDAYLWRTPGGERRLQPRSELNARYSMGWATGFAALQRP